MTDVDGAHVDLAVVLGPGGVVGTAWLAGLVQGLHEQGVELAEADLIVGTSAGAIIGAAMTVGRDLSELAVLPPDSSTAPRPDADRMSEVFAILGDPVLDKAEALGRVGQLAIAARPVDEDTHLERMERLVSTDTWPQVPLLIPTVSAETGEARVWTRDSGVPLLAAVGASCAFPVAAPPITVGGGLHMDGSLRAGTNTDLVGAAALQVIVEPLAHLFPSHEPAGAGAVVKIRPDAKAVRAIGADLADRSAWQPSYKAGFDQAPDAATLINQAMTSVLCPNIRERSGQ